MLSCSHSVRIFKRVHSSPHNQSTGLLFHWNGSRREKRHSHFSKLHLCAFARTFFFSPSFFDCFGILKKKLRLLLVRLFTHFTCFVAKPQFLSLCLQVTSSRILFVSLKRFCRICVFTRINVIPFIASGKQGTKKHINYVQCMYKMLNYSYICVHCFP